MTNHPNRRVFNKPGDFKKVVRLGMVRLYPSARNRVSVFCKIEFKDGRLSISGVEGPRLSGNCTGSCGQIDMHLRDKPIDPAPGWTRGMLAQFFEVWKTWHLNDMQAGTPAQMAELAKHKFVPSGGISGRYAWALATLRAAALAEDNGYKYGSAWLRKEVPADVLAFLQSLPETDVKPAWV